MENIDSVIRFLEGTKEDLIEYSKMVKVLRERVKVLEEENKNLKDSIHSLESRP